MNANLTGMGTESHRVIAATAFAAALAALCALALSWTGSAGALDAPRAAPPERAQPPTAAALARKTRRLMQRPRFMASPRTLLRRGSGGTGIDPSPSPSGKGALLPKKRVLDVYGAPQLAATALGKRSPRGAARLAAGQAAPYAKLGDRRVIAGLDLIGVVANSTRGSDGLYRTRQPDALIASYLKAARSVGGRLTIDIQPGRSPIMREVKALGKWIAEPDVDIAIDPEWNVGRRGVPGRTQGSVNAREVNAVSRSLQKTVKADSLPPKLLVVHQFQRSSIRQRSQILQRKGVQTVLNFDGIGSPGPKIAGYKALATDGTFNGFSLFLSLDRPLIRPAAVLRLDPAADFLLIQ